MTEFALLIDNQFREIRRFETQPEDIPHKQATWHPVVRRQAASEFTGLEDGNWIIQTIDPATLPLRVPSSITPRQLRLILLQQNKMAEVKQMIAAASEATQVHWEYASQIRRDDTLLNQMATQLGYTSEQVDQLFIAAAQL